MERHRFLEAKSKYATLGVDIEEAIRRCEDVSFSVHCWQGDDVGGFDRKEASLSGGIASTGNYLGKARTPEELMNDLDIVLAQVPGNHRLNLHASYAIFEDCWVDRDQLKPEHFKQWVDYAKQRNLKIDFNPTCFGHPLATEFTLSSADDEVRLFWVRHVQSCIKISEYFAKELNSYCLMNIWIPDGFKDIPSDRLGPRVRLKESLDDILSIQYDKDLVRVSVESKVFGIGIESYTVGSHEFYLNYAKENGILYLLDNGHFHPTELVSDKVSSMLLFNDLMALHLTRSVRWDSDHVVLYDEETKEIMKEIVFADALDRVMIGIDFFDASINRVAAWAIGVRNVSKSLLYALCLPQSLLKQAQEEKDYTKRLLILEEMKTFPFSDIWDEYCNRHGVAAGLEWFDQVKKYEESELSLRGVEE